LIGPQTLLESFYFSDPWKPRKSFPNSCAPKFTQVHILAFPNFLQFFGKFWDFPIISVTRISLFIFLNLEIIFNGFPFYFLFQPSRPAHSFSLGLPAGPSHPAHLASQPLGPRVPLAYFVEDVFFFDSHLPFSAPSLSPLTDAWALLVSSFFHHLSTPPLHTSRCRPEPLLAPPSLPLFKSRLNPP
jgi:hypothetical protein